MVSAQTCDGLFGEDKKVLLAVKGAQAAGIYCLIIVSGGVDDYKRRGGLFCLSTENVWRMKNGLPKCKFS